LSNEEFRNDLDGSAILREQKVMLDFHLTELYGVETRALKQAVRRNPDRFPEDFMFEITQKAAALLVSQTVIPGLGKSGAAVPMAFTEQGVAMLSSVRKIRRHDTPVVQSTMKRWSYRSVAPP